MIERRNGCFYKNTAGNVSVIFAIMMLAIICAIGAAVDYSKLVKEHRNARDSVDSAALAVAVEMSKMPNPEDVDVRAIAQQFVDSNKKQVFGEIKFDSGVYDTIANEIIVKGKVEVPTSFMGLFGTSVMTADVTAVSGPIGRPNNIDVMLVLDNTDSIGYQDLNTLVSSSRDLVAFLHDNKGTADIRIGVVPFSRFVNVGTSFSNVSWINFSDAYNPDNSQFSGCVHPEFNDADGDLNNVPSVLNPVMAAYDYQKYPYSNSPASATSHPLWWKYKWDLTSCQISPVTPLSANRNHVMSRLNEIRGNSGGPTYIPAGLKWGHSLLNETSPIQSLNIGGGQRTKVMVLMTDGGNKLYWIREQESPEDLRTDAESDVMTKEMCRAIKQSGTRLITVGFKFDESIEEFARAKDVLTSCASDSGGIYEPGSRQELEETFEKISKDILETHVRLKR